MKIKPYNLLIIIAVLCIFFSFNSLYEFIELPKILYLKFLPALVLMQLLYWLLAAITWKVTVTGTANQSIPLVACFRQCISMIVGKYIPGKLWGMVARATQLKEYHVGYHNSVSLTYLEFIFGFHAGLTLSLLCMGIVSSQPVYYLIAAITILFILFNQTFNRYLFGSIEYLIRRFLNRDITFSAYAFNAKTYFYIYLFYLLDWIFLALIQAPVYLLLFNRYPSMSLLMLIVAAQTISVITGFFAFFMPAGIGVRESVFSLIMTSIMPLPEAVLLSVSYRLWSTAADMSLGLLYFVMPKNK